MKVTRLLYYREWVHYHPCSRVQVRSTPPSYRPSTTSSRTCSPTSMGASPSPPQSRCAGLPRPFYVTTVTAASLLLRPIRTTIPASFYPLADQRGGVTSPPPSRCACQPFIYACHYTIATLTTASQANHSPPLCHLCTTHYTNDTSKPPTPRRRKTIARRPWLLLL